MDRRPATWMLSDALALLARAERLHQHFFGLDRDVAGTPCWEPPLDLVETEREIVAFVALPGVDPDQAEAMVRDGQLVLQGVRHLPGELRGGSILRMELPQGRFERRISLPPGHYEIRQETAHGVWIVRLIKLGGGPKA